MTQWFMQIMSEHENNTEAKEVFALMENQDGFQGGRILEPDIKAVKWRVQTFHDTSSIAQGSWLPDGCRLVIVPNGQRKALGMKTEQ